MEYENVYTVILLAFLNFSPGATDGKANVASEVNDNWDLFKTDGDGRSSYDTVKQTLTRWRESFASAYSENTAKDTGSWRLVDSTEIALNNHEDLFQGDIVLTPSQAGALELPMQQAILRDPNAENQRDKRNVIKSDSARWTSPIPYRTVGMSTQAQTVIRQAVKFWQDNSCLDFQENGSGRDSIRFFVGSGCYSSVGRTGGEQGISIGQGCEYFAVVAHEMEHALGVWHEQSRSDRDDYIRIVTSNIDRNNVYNFDKIPESQTTTFGLTYDFGSVMHYGDTAFALNPSQPVIVPLDAAYQKTFGQRVSPSFIDVKKVNLKHLCPNKCPNPPNCQNGGFANSRNCEVCLCPEGLGGATCEQVQPSVGNAGGTLSAQSTWQSLQVQGTKSYWLIRGPAGTQVEIQFTAALSLPCEDPCSEHYIEVKTGPDFQPSGPRFCCRDRPVNLKSGDNRAIIISKGQVSSSAVQIQYRYTGSPTEITTAATPAPTPAPTTKPPPGPTDPPTPSRTPRPTRPTTLPTRPTQPPSCPQGGIWSEWYSAGDCSKPCGACGIQRQIRRCLGGQSCPCTGPTTRQGPCGYEACPLGQIDRANNFIVCCSPFRPMWNKDGTALCAHSEPKMFTSSDCLLEVEKCNISNDIFQHLTLPNLDVEVDLLSTSAIIATTESVTASTSGPASPIVFASFELCIL